MFILRKKLNNDLQEAKGNIRVYCRIRPSKKGESAISITS
jgi:kinesin family protein C1